MMPELNTKAIVEAAGNGCNDPPLLATAFDNFLRFKDDWSRLQNDRSPAASMDELNALVYHYVAECYGRTEIKRWLKVNKGRSVLDMITASDLAFSILVYDNYSSRWTSEIWTKAKQSSMEGNEEQDSQEEDDAWEEEQEQSGSSNKKRKKAPSNMPSLPFSKPKTKKLKYLETGWTGAGVQRYRELEESMKRLMRNETLWNKLKRGWESFISGLHEDNQTTCWIPQFRRMNSVEEDDDILEEEEVDGFDFELPTPALGTLYVPQILTLI